MLLSIAIPTYNRITELSYSLDIFIDQIKYHYEDCIEIVITDDMSNDSTEQIVANYLIDNSFIKYYKNSANIGLEKNLIHCTKECKGQYLWIFGDDDYIEKNALNTIIPLLKTGDFDFIVLNRTRRNKLLDNIISNNWMNIELNTNIKYSGLNSFTKEWGLISIIGFISVNIFKRIYFSSVDNNKYYGIMYPQLGVMIEAFHDKPLCLVGKPLVCHRTETAEEKRLSFQDKELEFSFMTNYYRRDSLYFSVPLISFLNTLVSAKALTYYDIASIKEPIFGGIYLTDFILSNIKKKIKLDDKISEIEWKTIQDFIDHTRPYKLRFFSIKAYYYTRKLKLLSKHIINKIKIVLNKKHISKT